MNKGLRLILGAVLILIVLMPIASGASASPTGYDIAPEFRDFYDQYGGVQTFGYAISPPVIENNRLVQYTERQRLEYHPEHQGTQWEVLLGLLGREAARAEGRDFSPGGAIPGARYFSATRHYLEPRFQQYWESRGGVRIFGYPITEPTWVNGMLVQYTERARFEYHPQNEGSDYEVLLGRLGRDLWDGETATAEPAAITSDSTAMLENMLNQERRQLGVPGLERSIQLARVAAGRSDDMAQRTYFSHTTPEGQNIFDIMRAEGMSWSRAGETLHRNRADQDDEQNAVERAFAGFMNSSEHRRILTDARYEEFGIGHTYGNDGRHYFTVIVMSR